MIVESIDEIGGNDAFDTLGRVWKIAEMEGVIGGTLGTIVGGLG